MTELAVGEDGAGSRLDVFLAARLAGVSRSKVQSLILRDAVKVNGLAMPARTKMAVGDVVVVTWLPAEPSRLTPVAMALDVLFEDDHIIVLNKPAGISVHPGAGDTGPTLVQGLLHHVGVLGIGEGAVARDPAAALRPGIVHRLDKDTTGAIVCAKTDRAHAALAQQFHDKTQLLREYLALLDGAMPFEELMHESYLFRDPHSRLRFASVPKPGNAKSRYAKSVFRRERVYGGRLSLARVRLFTGRTHQIRIHAKDIGLPIIGDLVYHRPAQLPLIFPAATRAHLKGLTRQMLHARLLGFRHPETGEALMFEAPLPPDFAKVLDLLLPFSQNG